MKPATIRLMISSRCSDLISVSDGTISFTDLRDYILGELENEKFLGDLIFDVVISEYIIAPADETSWNKCLMEITESDLVLVFFTGHEGYKAEGKSIGICFAEYIEAVQSNPSKVFLLDFRNLTLLDEKGKEIPGQVKTKSEFAREVSENDTWLQKNKINHSGSILELKEEVRSKCFSIIREGITEFVLAGSRALRQENHIFGEGLQWSKLNYSFRQEAIVYYMQKTVNNFFLAPDFRPLKQACFVHAIPDAMSVSEAREMVGRPYLKDLKHLSEIDRGPVHFIGVYKNATEGQVRDVIGHQDVAIIQESFGYYVWDLVNHIQLIYITNCKDPGVTVLRTQEFFSWVRKNKETDYIIDRAVRRHEILKTINKQKIVLKGELR